MSAPIELLNPREIAEANMTRMLGAIRAQRQQLLTLQPGVGGPSTMSTTKQLEGLTQAEASLQNLVTYGRQLEGAVAALGHLTVTTGSAQAAADEEGTAAIRDLIAAVTDGCAALAAEVHSLRDSSTAPRLLTLVQALQTAYAITVTVPEPTVPAAPAATAPAVTTPTVASPTPTVPAAPTNVLLTTYSAAWSDGYRAGYPAGYQSGHGAGYQAAYGTAWAAGRATGWAAAYLTAWRVAVRATWDDVLARIAARL